jgi:hypothetical protein
LKRADRTLGSASMLPCTRRSHAYTGNFPSVCDLVFEVVSQNSVRQHEVLPPNFQQRI